MKDDLSERLLAKIMNWSPQQLSEERIHLQILANCKYDSYEQYRPGTRFITSLANWLRTFQTATEKDTAFRFVLSRLIFLSDREMQHLVVTSYPYHIRPHIIRRTASEKGIFPFPINLIVASDEYKKANRRCLYLGLSDGARSDSFRRGNSRDVNNEQIVSTYQFNHIKADGLLKDLNKSLRKEPEDTTVVKFDTVVLLDDFNGSGTTLFRMEKGQPDGKLSKIVREISDPTSALGKIVEQQALLLLFIFYVSTEEALASARAAVSHFKLPNSISIAFEAVQIIPSTARVDKGRDPAMCALIEHAQYYDDEASKDEHLLKGNVQHARYGFAGSALPFVLAHNTPNNSIFLLWSTEDYRINGLFPRVPRHRPE